MSLLCTIIDLRSVHHLFLVDGDEKFRVQLKMIRSTKVGRFYLAIEWTFPAGGCVRT